MGSLLSLVAGWKGYAAVALLCLLAGASATWRVMSWREQAHANAAAQHVVKVIDYQRRITFDVGMKFEEARIEVANDTRKRLDEVPTHVTAQADAACPVTLGFLRVFNDAVHGPVPGPAAGPDDAPTAAARPPG